MANRGKSEICLRKIILKNSAFFAVGCFLFIGGALAGFGGPPGHVVYAMHH
jgi:hypothetical protein